MVLLTDPSPILKPQNWLDNRIGVSMYSGPAEHIPSCVNGTFNCIFIFCCSNIHVGSNLQRIDTTKGYLCTVDYTSSLSSPPIILFPPIYHLALGPYIYYQCFPLLPRGLDFRVRLRV